MSQSLIFFPIATKMVIDTGYQRGLSITVFDEDVSDFLPDFAEAVKKWNWAQINAELMKKHNFTAEQEHIRIAHQFRCVLDAFWKYDIDHIEKQCSSVEFRKTEPAGWENIAISPTDRITRCYTIAKQNPNFRFVFGGVNHSVDIVASAFDLVAVSKKLSSSPHDQITELSQKVAFLERENLRLNKAIILPKLIIELEDDEDRHRNALIAGECDKLSTISARFEQLQDWHTGQLHVLQTRENEMRERIKKELFDEMKRTPFECNS